MAENSKKQIPGFNPQEFAENISMQAAEVIPPEIQGNDRTFITEVIKRFCFMAGDAVLQDEKCNFNADEASLICQFIGEWTFHKSIDLTKGGIDINLREGILQKVAFTIFEIVKQGINKKIPQEQLIELVENQVNKSFKNALEELKKKNILDDEAIQRAESQSNVDNMVQATVEEETKAIQEMSDRKILKLASLALLIRSLSKEKQETILGKFNEPESRVLRDYLNMENLEAKVDPKITQRCLGEVKSILPQPKHSSSENCMFKLKKLIFKNGREKIDNLVQFERPIIKATINDIIMGEEPEISPHIKIVLFNYISEKVSW